MKTYTRKCREKDFTTKETKSKPQILSISNNSKRSKITDYFYKAITDDSQGGEEEEEKVIIKASLEKAAATTTAAAAAACPLKLRQTFLDFGQKNLFMTVCKECGLCYDPSFPQDVKIHKVEHDRYFSCFDSTKYEKYIIWRELLPSGDSICILDGGNLPSWTFNLLEFVNNDMNAISQSRMEIQRMKIYLYVSGKIGGRIIGLMSLEFVNEPAIRLSTVDHESGVEWNVKVSISRIWISKEYRRNGYANQLLSSIRNCQHKVAIECSREACIIPKDLIAFSHPTEMGKKLAMNFLASPTKQDIIVYPSKDGSSTKIRTFPFQEEAVVTRV